MDPKEAIGTFEETVDYQKNYESLLAVCDAEGTMILQDRLRETDQDIPPHRFFRRGTREYVFPQQEVSLPVDTSCVIDPHPQYSLKTEEQIFDYDPDLVKGRLRIEYNDADNRPIFKVTDPLGESKLPEAVTKTLDDIF